MRRFVFSILFGLMCYWLPAQTIRGTIFDSKTGETVPGVAVYINGTTIITTSDKEGAFTLVVHEKINANLVLSHLSYEPLIIEKPFEYLKEEFYLTEKVNTINEVRVVADRYSRLDKMQVFKEQFLGTSMAGKSCIIANEEDIVLYYDYETNSLIGRSIQPIVLDNKYLSYHIIFDLHSFYVTYSEPTLNMDKAISTSFLGTSSFIDQNPYNMLYAQRREKAYLGSIQYFWKNLVNNTLKESQCSIYNRFKRVDWNQYFTITNSPPQKNLHLIPDTDLNRKHLRVKEENIYGVIGVVCKGYRSEIVFLTNRISVDSFGNPDPIDKLLYFGDMGIRRLGDMLPQNYMYAPQKEAK